MKPMMMSKYTQDVVGQNLKLRIAMVVLVLVLIVGLTLGFIFEFQHKPNNPTTPKLPIFQLLSFSATPLSDSTNPSTWNLTLSLTNPNHKLSLSYSLLVFRLIYPLNDIDRVPIGTQVKLTPSFVQPRKTLVLSPIVVNFSTKSIGVVNIADKIISDQANGTVQAGLNGIIMFTFQNQNKNNSKILSCVGLNIVFQNKGGLGLVSNLPKNVEISGVLD